VEAGKGNYLDKYVDYYLKKKQKQLFGLADTFPITYQLISSQYYIIENLTI